MSDFRHVCAQCGLSNPRQWRTCARCGQPLGSSYRMGGTLAGSDTNAAEHSIVEQSTPGDVEMPIIGQTSVLESLQASIERGFTLGLPSLIGLEGPSGSGKSRLLIYASEFAARIVPDVRIYYAAAREGDGGYTPFTKLMLERFRVQPSTSPAAIRGQMSTSVGETIGSHDALRVAETTHLLGHVAGVPFPDSPFLTPLEGDPSELQRRARQALRTLFEGESQKQPVLLLLDNMHLADDAAWSLLGGIVECEGHLAVVCTGDATMSQRVKQLNARGESFSVKVPPLREEDVASMLHVLVPNFEEIPEPLVAALAHRTGGNPGAMRELVFSLSEAGLFVPTPSGGVRVDIAKLERGELPVTIEDAVRSRLKRLESTELSVLEHASIVGQVFWSGAVLAQVRSERASPGKSNSPETMWPTDGDEDALDQVLGRLVEKGLVFRTASSDLPGTDEFSFVYAPTRDYLYNRIDATRRTQRHAIVARYLAVRAELSREGVAARIAPHLERAGLPARAGRAYLEAAAAERRRLQTRTALRYIEKALPLISPDDVARKIDALHEHGVLLTTLGRYEDAVNAFTEMLALAWQHGAPNKGGAALNRLARIERMRGADERARTLLARALELFRRAGDLRGVASTLDDLAQVLRLRGLTGEAAEAATEALEIRREFEDRRGEAVSLMTLGTIEYVRGQVSSAEQYFLAARDIRESLNETDGLAQTDAGLGLVAYARGDRDAAIDLWRSALARAKETGDARMQAFMLNNIGEALIDEGKLDEADEKLTQAKEIAEATADLRARAEIARNRGMLALRRSDDHASRLLEEALNLAKEYGAKEILALAYRAMGHLHGRTIFSADGGINKSAEEAFNRSIELFRDANNEKEATKSSTELALHLVERGDVGSALARFREARTVMKRLELHGEVERIEKLIADFGG